MSDLIIVEQKITSKPDKSEVYNDGILTVRTKENLPLSQDYSLDIESERGDVALSFDAPLQPILESIVSVVTDEPRAYEVVDNHQTGVEVNREGGKLSIKASALQENSHTLRQKDTTIHADKIFRGDQIKGGIVNIGVGAEDVIVDGKSLNTKPYKGVASSIDLSLKLPPLRRHAAFEDDQPDGTVVLNEGNITITIGDQDGYVLIPHRKDKTRRTGKVRCINKKGTIVFDNKDGVAYQFGEGENLSMLRVFTAKGDVEIK